MLGHIKKDFIVIKNEILCLLGFWVFYGILIIAAGTGDNEYMFARLIYVLLTVFPLIVTMQLSARPILLDEDSGWTGYALSLPGDYLRYVNSKYLSGLLMQFFGLLLSLSYIVLIRICSGIKISFYIPAVVLCATIVLMCIEMPFYFKFGYRAGETIKGILFLAMVFGAFIYLLFGDITWLKGLDYEKITGTVMNMGKHKEFYMMILSSGAAVVGVLSGFVSRKVRF